VRPALKRLLLSASLPLAMVLVAFPSGAQASAPSLCAQATAEQPLNLEAPTLTPGPEIPAAAAIATESTGDYRHRLRSTPLGWARLDRWCVWVEPAASTGPAALWDGRWHRAVQAALATWALLVPITVVDDPAQAQIRVERRRPPLQEINGRLRAIHGRSLLRLLRVQRHGQWRLEPQVLVLIGPGQAEAALQATALHELGHAVGLWGHSDRPGDALAAVPGGSPVLAPSDRDRRTLIWLSQQATRFGRPEDPLSPPGSRQ